MGTDAASGQYCPRHRPDKHHNQSPCCLLLAILCCTQCTKPEISRKAEGRASCTQAPGGMLQSIGSSFILYSEHRRQLTCPSAGNREASRAIHTAGLSSTGSTDSCRHTQQGTSPVTVLSTGSQTRRARCVSHVCVEKVGPEPPGLVPNLCPTT